ncbi:hypothetical protein BASA82_001081 [Batrachochytrium salamandrivorans]|nr:hypothetical protein BASA82_001081 [Batrachochytrium salamandrivorans]
MSFPESTLVWVPDSQAKFVPARVVRTFIAGEPGLVALLDDTGKTSIFEIELEAAITSTLTKMDEESLANSQSDMVNLKELNDASIMHNLRMRYLQDDIYTSIGDVLIAINPFKLLPIYTPLMVDKYVRQQEHAPHIFRTADEVFARLIDHKRDQACMVTGESGSGKTETTKLFLQYLAEVSANWSQTIQLDQVSSFPLSDRILKSNPLLESFGNAVTRKNHNSSRFGKMICVNFNPTTCEITSAKSTIFLLEKSRLPIQDVGERNFHIFYQLCAAAKSNAQIQQKYWVLDVDECRYLANNNLSSTKLPTSDLIGFEMVQRSMTVLNFSLQVQSDIFSIVSAILHLGNLDFCQDDSIHNCEASRIHDSSLNTLEICAKLLGLPDVDVLHSNLCYKSVQAGGKEAVKQPQSLDRSRKSRDALAIHLYSSLFEFVTHQVNAQQQSTRNGISTKSIAILDIFGFEAFEGPHNSFEQLCINYCNEKLQQSFNDVVFNKEKLLYEQEGLLKSVNLEDMLLHTHKNTLGVLELFERPRLGLFALLDEECSVPGGTDLSFLKKVNNEYKDKGALYYGIGKKNLVDTTFIIKHYVGPVVYLVRNFLEKNDGGFLSKDLQSLCLTSSLSVLSVASQLSLSSMLNGTSTNTKWHLASQFANQLDLLMKELNEMEPSFVRCIKPNAEFQSKHFTAGMVLDQLKCAGIMEVCRIRQLGFPIRRLFAEFASRYGVLLGGKMHKQIKQAQVMDDRLIKAMLEQFAIPRGEFACGKQRVFLKTHCFAELELQLARFKTKHVIKIQRRFRGHYARKRTTGIQSALRELQLAITCQSVDAIQLGLEHVQRWFPGEDGGKHLLQVQQAWKLLSALEEMRWSLNLISRAVLSKDTNQIRSAIACTSTIVQSDHPIVLQAKQALEVARKRDLLLVQLNDLVNSPTVTASELQQQMELAKSSKYEIDPFTLEKINAKLERLMEQARIMPLSSTSDAAAVMVQQAVSKAENASQHMLDTLRSAVQQRDPLLIARQLVVLFQHGLESHPDAQLAMQLEQTLRVEMQENDELQQMQQVLEMKREHVLESDLVLVEVIGRKSSTLKLKADKVVEDARDRMEAQTLMLSVLEIGEQAEFAQVRLALERAYAAGLKTGETVYRVQKLMRSKNRARRLAKPHRVVIDVQGPVPEKLSKRVGNLRSQTKIERDGGQALIAEATESDRYLLENYYQVRAPDTAFTRTRIQCLGNVVIDKAILENTPTAEGVGEMISKLILGYTGERSAAFPATCAIGLLELGQRNTDVGDEVYVQICAHLTENHSSESATRSWQLLCLCIGTFYPSGDLLFFIIRFLIDRAEGRTDASLPALANAKPKLSTTLDTYTLEQRYAWYALKRLQHDLSNEIVCEQLPSMEEISAFGERVPLVTNITYPDGSLLMEDMIISPLHTCQDIVTICLKQSGIHQVEMGPSYGLLQGQWTVVQCKPLCLQPPTNLDQERRSSSAAGGGSNNGDKGRFRLSITAVFGLAKAGGNFVAATAATVRRNSVVSPKSKQTIRRTDEELDWDVPLLPTDFVSDVLLRYLRAGRGAPRLVFKKRIFVPEFERLAEELRAEATDENLATTEAMTRIGILQAVDDFSTGALPFDKEDDVVDLVACRVALKFDNRLPGQ